eukprot:CAMPEP_0172733070 /NCGR_PEP_ID=MMETSP1074-20121228/106060_1 /TAXON_ID=2916 /ORGANISM="Ceratium fusus, Strain PA161109" /LENGTH=88 /DNA_ID=CAMNT_0013561501 /DNA_START=101 /DNA_END=363 /DNA_ORIENTATION=-
MKAITAPSNSNKQSGQYGCHSATATTTAAESGVVAATMQEIYYCKVVFVCVLGQPPTVGLSQKRNIPPGALLATSSGAGPLDAKLELA